MRRVSECLRRNCDRPVRGRGMCEMHYARWFRHTRARAERRGAIDANAKARFLAKVQRGEGCWLWSGSRSWRGYGYFWSGAKNVLAHRFSYELFSGKIPDGMAVCHSCDNPSCVNPAHLWVGTIADNNLDRDRKGRHVSGNAKLNFETAQRIRQAFSRGRMSQRDIAERYGIDRSSVSLIVRNKIWRS